MSRYFLDNSVSLRWELSSQKKLIKHMLRRHHVSLADPIATLDKDLKRAAKQANVTLYLSIETAEE